MPHNFKMSADDISAITDSTDIEALLLEIDTVDTEPIRRDWESVSSRNNNRISRVLLTVFPDEADVKYLKPETYFNITHINLWCGQFEICPSTERLHAHLYVEFKRGHQPRFNTIRGIIEHATGKTGDIQVPKRCSNKQRACAVNYVLKQDTRLESVEQYIWEHNHPKVKYDVSIAKKKKKNVVASTEDLVDYIESKPKHWTWDQILHENETSKKLLATCSWGPKYHQGRHAETPRRTIANVIVLYGAGGTGKTTLAYNWDKKDEETQQERYYKRNCDDGKFWGGGRTAYKNQRIIHLEEFCGQETAANFKEICDIGKVGPSINIKNSGTELNHETVIITSNNHPAAWYKKLWKEDPKQWTPIARRFTQVWFFPEKREDGSQNIPDEHNEPHYIDQTDEFKDQLMLFNYQNAIYHSDVHWPLPEERVGFNPAE